MNIARLRRIRLLFYAFVWWAPAPAIAAELCATPVGQIVSIQGTVEIQEGAHGIRRQARLNEPLCDGTVIFVGDRSRAEASLVDQSTYRLDQNTTLRLVQVRPGARSLMELLRGVTYFFARQPRSLAIDTPFINAAVEGTEFILSTDADQTLLTVFEGAVLASNDRGELLVASGSSAVARAGEAPEPYLPVRPRDAVHWALYYPFVLLPLADASGAAAGVLPEPLGGAVALAGRGEYPAAFARFDAIPEADRTSEFYLYRAGALLAVGRIDEARTDIAAALALNPGNGPALALRAVIAVAQNDDAAALEDANRAVELSPTSAAAKIALSYALQSQFQLEAARDALQQAVTDEPENALAYARLSELWLMLGYRERALRAARTAQALAPDLERTQSVLGFAALAEFDTKRARTSFERAIEIDSANPQPRLGLGLAVIRDGSLKQGRREIERAVALDPDNALLRSYLGKAFFEEKKDNLASDQFAMAKALDPKDPTPWFYDAIQLQTLNRPVDALRSLEKSIELNDNRAVYRSRELLDEDRAARGASLGRIYNDVGFEQLGINEAAESLTLDPANASAHRFLSDVYATQPRREIARASELLQSQLLQDININPVQPSLAASDFNIITQGGPAQAGFNEYNSLFERNRAQLSLSGIAGTDWTRGDEAVVSGVYDRYSLSAGQFHYQSDGFRQNFNVTHDVYNAYAQAAITPELNVQAEVVRRYTEQGDLQLNFNQNDYAKAQDFDIEDHSARFGVRYSPDPNNTVLGSMIYTHIHTNNQDEGTPELLTSNIHDSGIQGEAQYIFNYESLNIIAGGGHYDIDSQTFALVSTPDFDLILDDSTGPSRGTNGYVYSNLHWPLNVKWTLGIGYDVFDEAKVHTDDINPKLGVQWALMPELSFCAAAFRTVRPPLAASQTLQPTQIAGFNQFFDDINGTRSSTYGVGIDVRPAEKFYLGAEFFTRELDTPVANTGDTIDSNEHTARLYTYWVPHAEWVVSGDMVFDRFHSDEAVQSIPKQLDTLSIPIFARYFSPTGFFAFGGLTFVNQSITWDDGATTYKNGDNNLYLLDTGIGYRLPRRLGIIRADARNLLNQRFNYKNDAFRGDQTAPSVVTPFVPERSFFVRAFFNY